MEESDFSALWAAFRAKDRDRVIVGVAAAFAHVAAANGVELVPSRMAFGGVGPRIADDAFAYLRDGILDVVRAEAGRLDGVYLSLHGASATTSDDDPEGTLLAAVRTIVACSRSGDRPPCASSIPRNSRRADQDPDRASSRNQNPRGGWCHNRRKRRR